MPDTLICGPKLCAPAVKLMVYAAEELLTEVGVKVELKVQLLPAAITNRLAQGMPVAPPLMT